MVHRHEQHEEGSQIDIASSYRVTCDRGWVHSIPQPTGSAAHRVMELAQRTLSVTLACHFSLQKKRLSHVVLTTCSFPYDMFIHKAVKSTDVLVYVQYLSPNGAAFNTELILL